MMDALYIGGTQCVHAKFRNNDSELFACHEYEMQLIADQFNLVLSIHILDEEDFSFLIMNKKIDYQLFYPRKGFTFDMSVEVSKTFHTREKKFIKVLNKTEKLFFFYDLDWSEPQVLYIATA